MTEAFVGGVRDSEGRRAFLNAGPNEVVGIELSSGRVLWRAANIGRPVAAIGDRLITVAATGQGVRLQALDAESGELLAAAGLPNAPSWLSELIPDPAAFQVHTSLQGDGLRLDWQARRRWEGGARQRSSPDELPMASGSVLVDPDQLAVTELQSAPAPVDSQGPPLSPAAPANVLGRAEIDQRQFDLNLVAGPAGPSQLTLDARALGGPKLWSTVLAELGPLRPKPPRP